MPLTQTVVGLLLHDDFDRPTGDSVGGGWNEVEESASDMRIESDDGQQVLRRAATTDERDGIFQVVSSLPTSVSNIDHIFGIQFRTERLSKNFEDTRIIFWGVESGWPGPAGSGYAVAVYNDTNSIFLKKRNQNPKLINVGVNTTAKREARAVAQDAGSGDIAFELFTISLFDWREVRDLVSRGTVTDTPGSLARGVGVWGGRENYVVAKLYVCGRGVTITGLPSGWKVALDGGTKVAESGGAATINVDSRGLPGSQIEVYDSGDVLQETISGTYWGGSEYSFSSPPAKPTISVDARGITTIDASGSVFSSPVGATHSQSQWQLDVAGGGFGSPVKDVTSGLDLTSHQYTGLTSDTSYDIRVRYQDDLGQWSEWSDPVTTSTLSNVPDKPVISVDRIFLEGVRLEGSAFNDEAGLAHASSQWQVDEQGGGFSDPIYDSGFDTSDLTLHEVRSVLQQNSNYIARVRYKDEAGGVSDWSDPVGFTTLSWSDCESPPSTVYSDCDTPSPTSFSSCESPPGTTWE